MKQLNQHDTFRGVTNYAMSCNTTRKTQKND